MMVHDLLTVPQAELHQVAGLQPGASAPPQGASQTVLARGEFLLQDVEGANDLKQQEASTIVARVGGSSWVVEPGSGVLRLGELSFAFSQPSHPTHQLVLILSADTQPEVVGLLEAILESVALYTEAPRALGDGAVKAGEASKATALAVATEEAAAPWRYESRTARGLQRAATSAASGVMLSAVWACDVMKSTSKRWRQGEPAPQPVQFSAGFRRRMERTAHTAKWAARATHKVGSALGWVASRVLGAGLWVTGLTRAPRAGKRPGAARETTHAAANGIDQVWETLEEAGYLVLTTARDSVSEVARHKYGADAGEVAASGMNAAVYSVEAAGNISGRAAARQAARATARDVLRKVAQTKVR